MRKTRVEVAVLGVAEQEAVLRVEDDEAAGNALYGIGEACPRRLYLVKVRPSLLVGLLTLDDPTELGPNANQHLKQ